MDLDELRKRGYELLLGVDFGYVNDPSVIICSLLDEENKKIYVYTELYQTGLLNNEIAEKLKLMGVEKSLIIADGAEMKSIDEIKKLGIRRIKRATKGAGSVLQGIQKLQQYELIVDSSCVHTLEELDAYSWRKDKKTGEYFNEPVDKDNHCMDALRYSLQCLSAKNRVRTIGRL